MFFKKKKKIDARLRFQQRGFTQELAKARQYKRVPSVRIASETKGWWSWRRFLYVFVLIVGIAGLIYLFCFRNFLFIRQVNIEGGDDATRTQATQTVSKYLDDRAWKIFPRRNELMLSTEKLKEKILHEDNLVYQVESIQKTLWKRTLRVILVPRIEELVLERDLQFYTISNDGRVMRQLGSIPGGLTRILISGQSQPIVDTTYFPEDTLKQLLLINRSYPQYAQASIEYLELVPLIITSSDSGLPSESILPAQNLSLPAQEVIVYTGKEIAGRKVSFKVFFDLKGDIVQTLEKLQLLLSQTPPDRLKLLVYIDMRFKNKGFVCLTNAPCAQEPVIAPPQETQVPDAAPPPPPNPPPASLTPKDKK